jgi:hypothetical protein
MGMSIVIIIIITIIIITIIIIIIIIIIISNNKFPACAMLFTLLPATKSISQVGSKSFRIYRHIFRDGFVNGQMLISITNDHLEQQKITNIWHRQAILFAVAKLREASEQLTSGRSDSLGEVIARPNNQPRASAICLLASAMYLLSSANAHGTIAAERNTFTMPARMPTEKRHPAIFSFHTAEEEDQISRSCLKYVSNPWVWKCFWTSTTSAK